MVLPLARFFVGLFALLLTSVSATSSPITHGEWLVLSGSNTVGAKLAPSWAQAFMAEHGVQDVQVQNLGNNEFKIIGTVDQQQAWITVRAHGSSTAFKNLGTKTADIGMASREVKTEEARALAEIGDLRSTKSEHVVAIDGLSIVVHPDNPIDSLSLSDLKNIFSGKSTNWKSFGGDDRNIKLYARDNKSGTWDSFKSLVLDKKSKLSRRAKRYESNEQLARDVAEDIHAIGFVGLSSVGAARVLAIRDGENAAMQPKASLVATEDYPLSRRLYLYTPEKPRSEWVPAFLEYVLSQHGQDIVEQIGFVSQNPVLVEDPVFAGPTFYKRLSEEGLRVSMNFRFSSKGASLDNKAKSDVKRLASFLNKAEQTGYKVQLVGFSHPSESPSFDTIISKLRASAVKRELFQYKIQTEAVIGMGAQRSIASDSHKNDRVEVWLYDEKSAALLNAYRNAEGMSAADKALVTTE